MKVNWSNEWPTKPGIYWAWGWPWSKKDEKERSPELSYVQARASSNNELFFICAGHFLYKGESGRLKWTPAELPDPPEEL